MIIIEEDTGIEEVGASVREADTRGGGRGDGVDRWVIWGVFRIEESVSLTKAGGSGDEIFKVFPNAPVNLKFSLLPMS